MLRITIIITLILFTLAVGAQVYLFFSEERVLSNELAQLKEKKDFFTKENNELEAKIKFLSQLENLEKELKSKFNYKNIGEKMMIIVQ